jgi:putative ABC transport system permease protein
MRWYPMSLFRSRSKDLSEELEFHLRMAVEERMARGESAEEARAAALREFGNFPLVQAVTGQQWGWGRQWMDAIVRDLKYAARQMGRSPGLAVTVIVMLALGIGANTALFTIFQQVVLATLPVRDAKQLVLLSHKSASDEGAWSTWGDQSLYFSYPAYVALRDGNHTLEGLAASAFSPVNITAGTTVEKANAEYVTGNYFSVLGTRAVLGRLIDEKDDRLHAGNAVAVLSEEYWRAHYGGDASVLNRVLRVNGVPFTIVGVVRFRGLTGEYVSSLFVPMAMQHLVMQGRDLNHDRLMDDLFYWITPVGRLKAGVSRAMAEAELNSIWLDWHRSQLPQLHVGGDFRNQWMKTSLSLKDGSQGLRFLESSVGSPIRILFWMVAVVLAIACSNVANLLLVKAAGRRRELAVQNALGASRWQLCRQALVEGLLLGGIGSVAGMAVGAVTLRIVLRMIPETSTLKTALSSHVDWRVLLFAVCLGLGTSLLFSLGPALSGMRVDPLTALQAGSRTVIDRGRQWHGVLVVGEIALSMALLMCAGLVALTLYHLRTLNPGYAISHCVTFTVDASALAKPYSQVRNEYDAIQAALERMPGVNGVSYASEELLGGDEGGGGITVRGFSETESGFSVDYDWITSEYLSTMQIPLLVGRNFSAQDTENSQKVAIVDTAFVRHYFNGDASAAIDGQLSLKTGYQVKTDIQIVGVVPQVRAAALTRDAAGPSLYMPYAQGWTRVHSHPASYYIRSTAEPAKLEKLIRSAVFEIDRDLPIVGLGTMRQKVDDSIFEQRLMALLACAMAGLALLMSATGLYGVLSFAVAQRTPEIGIRIALGASRTGVASLVFRRMAVLMLAGVTIGAPLAWGGSRILVSLMQITGNTAYLFAGSAVVMGLTCGLAALLPLQKALRVDPMQTLRAE